MAARRAKFAEMKNGVAEPRTLTVQVNGENYRVTVAYGDNPVPAAGNTAAAAPVAAGAGKDILSPLEGKFFLTKSNQETPIQVGSAVTKGQVVCYIEAMKTYNAIAAEFDGTVTAICFNNGDTVSEDDVIIKIQPAS